MKVLVINGSYRDDGITDQIIDVLIRELENSGIEVETVLLSEYPIDFCLNCRECTQQPGDTPGRCVLNDGFNDLTQKIEQADGYILASPTNFGSVTAAFKRFMERLVVFAYWPWGAPAPKFRKADATKKKAILVSSCAAPGLLGRLFYTSLRQLKMAAKVIGAKTVGIEFAGLVSKRPDQRLSQAQHQRLEKLASRLIDNSKV